MLQFRELEITGVKLIATTAHVDERGAFARLYCPTAFREAGIEFTSTQMNLSTNAVRHTLRGMHFQMKPYEEAKLVRVVHGAIYDVVADLRADSPTRGKWTAVELSAANLHALLIPEGCAHGFLTLEDDTHVIYQMGREFVPGHAAGFRFDDPRMAIEWPAAPAVMSDADRNWPQLRL
jgi:dTDP-4-dehydrorhamnose 3,5-epimerase